MNRQKKIQSLYKKRFKRAQAKLGARPKSERYVSKADRAKAETETQEATEIKDDGEVD